MKRNLLFLGIITLAHAVTQDEYDTTRSYVISEIRSAGGSGAATLVRLSFHDCVSHCDGCINMDNPSNAGLQPAIDIMEAVYESLVADGIDMARADLWAIGGRVGAEWGMEKMPGHRDFVKGEMKVKDFVSPFATFQYGRVDCDTAPYTEEEYEFPDPHMTHDEMFEYFREKFEMTDDQIVALIGAHTVGKTSEENSGHGGPWLPSPDTRTFDNTFFSMMINTNTTYNKKNLGTTGDDARPQYRCSQESSKCGIMLNTDFALFYDMPLDQDTFLATCDPTASVTDCPEASTYSTALAYAQDNELWIEDYVAVYDIMTSYVDESVALTAISE